MVSVITALFFTCAAAFAVITIGRSFTGSVERIDALFAQYRAVGQGRAITGQMRPPVRFHPAPAPDFAPRIVVTLSAKAAEPSPSRISASGWRAAA